MIETTNYEQKMIDNFIRYNRKILKSMDDHNRRDCMMWYMSQFSDLSSSRAYDRKLAVREILTTFMADWG